MKTTDIYCGWCGALSRKAKSEIDRQLKKGRAVFFCNNSCSGYYVRAIKDKPRQQGKVCLFCNKEFITGVGKAERTFCSRGCASSGSVTEVRKEAARKAFKLNGLKCNTSVAGVANMMKKREAFRYQKLLAYLDGKIIKHEFEKPIDRFVYDLVIEDSKLIFEFDEARSYAGVKQADIDAEKDKMAQQHGYKIVRIPVNPKEIIDHCLISSYF